MNIGPFFPPEMSSFRFCSKNNMRNELSDPANLIFDIHKIFYENVGAIPFPPPTGFTIWA